MKNLDFRSVIIGILSSLLIPTFYGSTVLAQNYVVEWESDLKVRTGLDIYRANPLRWDVDGDGIPEIIAQDWDTFLDPDSIIYIYNSNTGEMVTSFKTPEPAFDLIGFFDVDGDGFKEAFFFGLGGTDTIVVYDWVNLIIEAQYDNVSSSTIYDIDGDGFDELIFFSHANAMSYVIGNGFVSTTETPTTPISSFFLSQNYPNPFNTLTNISFNLKDNSIVSLRVFNLLGQTVRTLLDQEMPIGEYRIIWDGKNNHGELVASGQYSYQLIVNDEMLNKKMILIK